MRNPSRSVLQSILYCYPTGFVWIRATCTVPASQEFEPQKCAVLARNGRTFPVSSYELETRNPSRLVLRSILHCYSTSFIRIRTTGTVQECQEFESQNHAVLARNGRTYPVTLYELEMRNPSRSVLRSILQCYPTSFIRIRATGTVRGMRRIRTAELCRFGSKWENVPGHFV
jgi:hypothetical protein